MLGVKFPDINSEAAAPFLADLCKKNNVDCKVISTGLEPMSFGHMLSAC